MQWKTPMFEPMRKLTGRCGRSLRRAMEAERSELLRQGFGGMTRVLSRWIDPKLMAPEREGSFSCGEGKGRTRRALSSVSLFDVFLSDRGDGAFS
jgi:hypothetical protein